MAAMAKAMVVLSLLWWFQAKLKNKPKRGERIRVLFFTFYECFSLIPPNLIDLLPRCWCFLLSYKLFLSLLFSFPTPLFLSHSVFATTHQKRHRLHIRVRADIPRLTRLQRDETLGCKDLMLGLKTCKCLSGNEFYMQLLANGKTNPSNFTL